MEFGYDALILDCYKLTRFTNGGANLNYLKDLPLDELFKEIEAANLAAEEEKRIMESQI